MDGSRQLKKHREFTTHQNKRELIAWMRAGCKERQPDISGWKPAAEWQPLVDAIGKASLQDVQAVMAAGEFFTETAAFAPAFHSARDFLSADDAIFQIWIGNCDRSVAPGVCAGPNLVKSADWNPMLNKDGESAPKLIQIESLPLHHFSKLWGYSTEGTILRLEKCSSRNAAKLRGENFFAPERWGRQSWWPRARMHPNGSWGQNGSLYASWHWN